MDLTTVLATLFKLFVLVALGYLLSRRGVLDSKVNKGLTDLLVNVTNPCLILGSLASAEFVSQQSVIKLVLFGLCTYLLLPVLAFVIVRLLRFDKKIQGITEMLLIFANTGFMAIPIMQSLYGDVAVFYVNILNIFFNLVCYTYGVYLNNRDVRYGGGDAASASATSTSSSSSSAAVSGGQQKIRFSWKTLLTPGFFFSALALVIYFLHIHIPSLVSDTLMYIGNVTPPLSMIIIGSVLGEYSLKSMFAYPKINILLTLKMLLLPFLMLFLAKLVFPEDSMIVGIITLMFAMPCASMDVMLAKQLGGNSRIASASVVYTTIISMAVIPLVFMMTHQFY